jgi:hypothetical protein
MIRSTNPLVDMDEVNRVQSRKTLPLPILSASAFAERHRGDDVPLINGLVRVGETMNIIASPKIGKTWLVAGMALSIAHGLDWMGFGCTGGRVLVIDCELKPKTLRWRYQLVAEKMDVSMDQLDMLSLRGDGRSIIELGIAIRQQVEQGYYVAIIWDALYRLLPKRSSENDNAEMMAIYNELDSIAAHTGAANLVIHHTSKGAQGEKSVTDVGAGAGAISRAADTHLTIRPHELADCAVVEAVCRSFSSPAPMTIRWNFPLWLGSEIEPEIKLAKGNKSRVQDVNDKETIDAISNALSSSWRTTSALRGSTGFGLPRVMRGLRLLGARSKKVRSKKTKKRIDIYALPEGSE